jgi:hypothetical protein
MEEIGNHLESGGRSGSPLLYEAPVFERPLKDSGEEEEGNDESAVSELAGQLLMSVALCKAELLEFISEAL